jgi:hypothetical protein
MLGGSLALTGSPAQPRPLLQRVNPTVALGQPQEPTWTAFDLVIFSNLDNK